MNQLDVSIIVVNWNTEELLNNCIKSIYQYAGNVDFEVIVIDNASSDGSVETTKKSFPEVTLIENSENIGYAAACNQGIRIARGRYALVLNSDTLICDSAIEKTVRYADKHPEAAVIGCQVRETQDKIMTTCFGLPCLLNIFLRASGLAKAFKNNRFFGRERKEWWHRDSEREVDMVPGVFMLVRHTAIDKVGLMDEDYFFYVEEVDWCYRFSKAGWKIIFWPGARIIHIGGGRQSSNKQPLKAYVQNVKSNLIFFRKHRGFISYLVARVIFLTLFGLKYCLLTVGSITKVKRAGDEAYRMEKQKASCAFKFSAFGIEPGQRKLHLRGFIFRQLTEIIKFAGALAYCICLPLRHKRPRRVIIYYHSVNERDIGQFERQMRYLAKKCRVMKVSEIRTVSSAERNVLVAVMFDDVFVSVMQNALPILRNYGLPAAFCVPTACLGRRPCWPLDSTYNHDNETIVSEEQVLQLDREGFEILSHTVTHPKLTILESKGLRAELVDSKTVLERIVGHEVCGVSYPFGAYDLRVCDAAKQVGYRLGFTIEPRIVNNSMDNMQIGRFAVSPEDSLIKFRLKVSGAYQVAEYLQTLKRRLCGSYRR